MLDRGWNWDHETDRCNYSCLSVLFIGDGDDNRCVHQLFGAVVSPDVGDISTSNRSGNAEVAREIRIWSRSSGHACKGRLGNGMDQREPGLRLDLS